MGHDNVGTALTQMTPRRRFGWIHRAVSLDRLQRPTEAKESRLPWRLGLQIAWDRTDYPP
jgi:hypothetical protein